VAHALEHAMGYGALSHGAAVGLGLLVVLAVSESSCGLNKEVLPRVRALLARFGLPTTIAGVTQGDVMDAAGRDKKVSAAGLGLVCLRAVGDPVWGVHVEEGLLAARLAVILA